ncbi:2TM domain-containing protein [Chryseobacterium sp. POL2]|uniref:2TM domain-containing protein n=1 Tax=Chryseobacterium sp. POL2 TaxID=2713414 RepID=UPI001E62140E|nr:2TM domain-containing protein [Chryseobacterium sp. POL2]
MENNENIKYQMAAKRVKDLKSFYTHLFVYLAVNLLLFFLNYRELPKGESIWQWQIWITPLLWGIGLIAHALSVFVPGFILSKNWEERKIKELMKNYK